MRLTHRFDHIQIEGEHGFGKPEERAYLHAMQALGVAAPETWMVGDNLEWEVVAPQRLGIYAIWIDVHGDGLPAGIHRQARPHHPLARPNCCRGPTGTAGPRRRAAEGNTLHMLQLKIVVWCTVSGE